MALNYAKMVEQLKKDGATKQSEVAQKQGLSIGQVSMAQFCLAQVEAGVFKTIPATGPSVKKARDGEGNRWELIGARAGISANAAKKLYEEAGGDPSNSYTGRGRNFNGASKKSGTASSKKTTAAGRASSKKTTAAKSGAKKTTAGRKGGAKKVGASVVRNRAGRRSSAANPS